MFAWAPTQAIAASREAIEQSLGEIADVVLAHHPDLEVSSEASADLVLSSLLEALGPDDLVVVGSSGHHGAAAFWLGSTPRYLVTHSQCPVVVVRGQATRGRPDRIVVGVGVPEQSMRALLWAADEADRQQVPLVVVHAWWYPYQFDGTPGSQACDLTRIDAACALERAVERVSEQFACDVSGELVRDRTTDGLLSVIRDGDLLVLGSRGQGPLRAGLVGSTVNSVLEAAVVPVVVVRDSAQV